MARKRSNRKTKRQATKKRTNHNPKYMGNLIGALLILLLIAGAFQFGVIGSIVVGLFKIFVGSSYFLLMAIVFLYAISLLIYGHLAHFRVRWIVGICIFYAGLLVFLHCQMFNEINQHSDFLNVTWNSLSQALFKSDSTVNIGGGMIGALLFAASNFLLGFTGSMFIAWIMMIAGLIVTFNLPWHKAILVIQQLIIKARDYIKYTSKTKVVGNAPKQENLIRNPSSNDKREQISQPVHSQKREPQINVASQPPSTKIQKDTEKPVKKETTEDNNSDLSWVASQDDKNYRLPPTTLLTRVNAADQSQDLKSIKKNSATLQSTLQSFGVDATVENVNLGPSVTKYEIKPAVGVKVSRITHLADDLALALAAKDIRIEAPIPGKSLIGIEVPNKKVATVGFRNMVESIKRNPEKPLTVPLGRTVTGEVMMADLTKMPHLLIAGATGSGKSVAINVILTSILLNAKPHQVKLLMIDPKKVELSVYNGIPHLLSPVVSDPKKAARALGKVVTEMERRYELFAKFGIRNINGYNAELQKTDKDDPNRHYLPLILVVVDELADLMMTVSKEVEDSIVRIAQMGRAAGIHMILATQRPSVDVITGLIKANVPSRIAFAVSSGVDSRTILDTNGAEKLIGRGDMLFQPIDQNKPTRVQGAFISDQDVENVVNFIKKEQPAEYDSNMVVSDDEIKEEEENEEQDELFPEALKFVVQEQKASTSLIQRRFRIGYNRAARIIDDLEQRGYIGPANGSKPRTVYKQPDDDKK